MPNDESFYSHSPDFEDFESGMPSITIGLPIGETLAVNGPRQTPLIITISNKVERNPKRDARMLASLLSSSLEDQTLYHLSEYLYTEFLHPLFQEQVTTREPLKPKRKNSKQIDEHSSE